MSLRGRVQDSQATYIDPILGVNLQKSEEDLSEGESSNMKNMVHHGRLTNRNGSTNLTTQLEASVQVKGGHKFYYVNGNQTTGVRLVAYNQTLATVTDAGTATVVYPDLSTIIYSETQFTTWSITNKCYISGDNDQDDMLEFDGTYVNPVGGLSLINSTYKWTLSGSGTNEYYCELAAGGDPSLADPSALGGCWSRLDGLMINATVGSLSVKEWDYGDNDTLGYSTIYVRMVGNDDPDTYDDGYMHSMANAVNVPGITTNPRPVQTLPFVDRLLCITSNGIERTDPRDPTIWSLDSSWATLRPSKGGRFTAMISHAVSDTNGNPVPGVLAFTEGSYYFITGIYLGVDVTASTGADSVGNTAGNPAHDNASITHIDNVGTMHWKQVTSVPGVGTFWITTTSNVYFVPTGHTTGRYVGTKIKSTGGSGTVGLDSMNSDEELVGPPEVHNRRNAWIIYKHPYVMLSFTIESTDSFNTYQYWLDVDKFAKAPQAPIWYGPMTGQSINSVWVENQQGDDALMGGEGDTTVGAFVYTLDVADTYTDAVGTADNDMACEYSTYLKSGGSPSREKVVQSIEVEQNTITGNATADIADISGTILAGVPVEKTFI